jgi:Domain of unknown function (DUF4136)
MDRENPTMRTKGTFLLCALMLTATLVFADEIRTDHDRSAWFYRYKTFMWVDDPQFVHTWMNEWIIKAINDELQARGLCLVTSNADLVVSTATATINRCPPGSECARSFPSKLEMFYAGLPGGWSWTYYWTPTPSTVVVEPFELDTLVVYLNDAQANRVVWWGTATEALKDIGHLNRDIERMFEYFPPA